MVDSLNPTQRTQNHHQQQQYGMLVHQLPVWRQVHLQTYQPLKWLQQDQQQNQLPQQHRKEAALQDDEEAAVDTMRWRCRPYEWGVIHPSPSPASTPTVQCPKAVVIDGSNVAFSKSKRAFSVKYLAKAIKYFQLKGHQVKAVVPSWRMFPSPNPPEWAHKPPTDDPKKLLTTLDQRGVIVWSYDVSDDITLLQLAREENAAIVSCDKFRDWAEMKAEYAKLAKRVVAFRFREGRFSLQPVPNLAKLLYSTANPQADVNKRRH